jgi:hypothetical protein
MQDMNSDTTARRKTMKEYTYRQWMELIGLDWDTDSKDLINTEVTVYDDGTAYYTDGGMRVPVPQTEAQAFAAVPSYCVRRPGSTAWANGLTWAEAQAEAVTANRQIGAGHIITAE